jgi:large subunit ribosomal protein L9e
MPRPVLVQRQLKIEDDVTIGIKAGVVEVQGPRGVLRRDLSHLSLEFEWVPAEKQVSARCWFGNRKLVARINTLFGHIKNMVTGVTKGFRYKMRFVTAHFPIKHTIIEDLNELQFTHFMGQRERFSVKAPVGVQIKNSESQKEEIWIEGTDVDAVSVTCARIHQLTHIRNKDLRKFLDGIYISEKGHIAE